MTRDELVEALRLHRAEIVEAEEWRPLADHVLELVQMGYLRYETTDDVIKEARVWLQDQLQDQLAAKGPCACSQVEKTFNAALDALAREPVLQADLEQITELRDSAEEALQQKQETIDGISAGIINPPSLETVLKLIQLEKRERLLVGLLRLVANEAVCECDDPDDDDANPLTCALLHPSTPGDWCPVCIVRKSLESDKPGPP